MFFFFAASAFLWFSFGAQEDVLKVAPPGEQLHYFPTDAKSVDKNSGNRLTEISTVRIHKGNF
ncbi:hypothetical protein FF38_11790 [Lucilia cuprina]|uniref:Uncharacterized protein n=1 Tax=Lucilia cuprina TaxID=7375 RepID=A0A0L0CD36_LUCCU|nr:hypothetical protein FF38_11790 [Lucilia cuprina]